MATKTIYSVVMAPGRYDADEVVRAAGRYESLAVARREVQRLSDERRARMGRLIEQDDQNEADGGFRVVADERAEWLGWKLDMVSDARR